MDDEQKNLRRSLPERIAHPNALGLLVYFIFTTVILLLLIPPSRVTDPVAKIFASLVWPCLILAGCLLFREQAKSLLTNISERIQSGDSVKILNWLSFDARTVEEKAARIPKPSEGDVVTLANVALLHTSFLPKITPSFNDGMTYLQIEIIVIAPKSVIDRVASVTYRFEDSYPPKHREQVRINRDERFKIKELANGTSVVRAEIKFLDSQRSLHLNRFIDLRPDGPRI